MATDPPPPSCAAEAAALLREPTLRQLCCSQARTVPLTKPTRWSHSPLECSSTSEPAGQAIGPCKCRHVSVSATTPVRVCIHSSWDLQEMILQSTQDRFQNGRLVVLSPPTLHARTSSAQKTVHARDAAGSRNMRRCGNVRAASIRPTSIWRLTRVRGLVQFWLYFPPRSVFLAWKMHSGYYAWKKGSET